MCSVAPGDWIRVFRLKIRETMMKVEAGRKILLDNIFQLIEPVYKVVLVVIIRRHRVSISKTVLFQTIQFS